MSEQDYERIAKLAYEHQYNTKPLYWEEWTGRPKMIEMVRLVARELGWVRAEEEVANRLRKMELDRLKKLLHELPMLAKDQGEILRLRTLAKKYSAMLDGHEPHGYPDHQERLKEIEGV